MALLNGHIFSKSLMMNTDFYALIPSPTPAETMFNHPFDYFAPGRKYQVLYLLHGALGDCSDWIRRTMLEVYAEPYQLVVIMPSAENSCYTDMQYGANYWTYVTEELPQLCRSLFPISQKREDTFVAGLSMGGFGAFKIALNLPERYEAAVSLSGALKIDHPRDDHTSGIVLKNIFGDPPAISGSENDLIHVLKKAKESGKRIPRLYQACGTEDGLYGLNVKFRDDARAMGVDLTYEEGPGVHDWVFWNTFLKKALGWLPLKRKNND